MAFINSFFRHRIHPRMNIFAVTWQISGVNKLEALDNRVGHIDQFLRYHYGGLGYCLVTCGDPLYSLGAFYDYGKVFPVFSFDFESVSCFRVFLGRGCQLWKPIARKPFNL